jgi:hypothetical protein
LWYIVFERKGGMNPFMAVIGLYMAASYLFLPNYWKHYEHHAALASAPVVTVNYEGLPGDPVNIGIVGSREELTGAFEAAGWIVPDRKNLVTLTREFDSILLKRTYLGAPISNLYLFGRVQDTAFEKPSYMSPKRRHHVRFWRAEGFGKDNRELWLGAATLDRGVGMSRFTGEITHHIDPDIDEERNMIVEGLERAGWAVSVYQVTGIGPTLTGRNAEGDHYVSDGEMSIVVLKPWESASPLKAEYLENPGPVKAKNGAFHVLKKLFKPGS